MNFSNRLKQLRKEHNLTQEKLAKEISKTRSTIAGYETERKEPDYETLKIIADFFNVSVDYLLGRTDIKNTESKFVEESRERYGYRGKRQAEELLENVQSMFDGGELPDEDKDEFFKAITDIYFDSKEKNKKYTPVKYREHDE